MDCSGVREHLTAHAQGELDSPELPEIMVHFAGCADCRKAYRQVCTTLRFLHTPRDLPLPAGSWSRLAAKLPPQDKPLPAVEVAIALRPAPAGLRVVSVLPDRPKPREEQVAAARPVRRFPLRHVLTAAAAALLVVGVYRFTHDESDMVGSIGMRGSMGPGEYIYFGPNEARVLAASVGESMQLQVGGNIEIEGSASYTFLSRSRCRIDSCASASFSLQKQTTPFVVETPSGEIHVVGTRFRLIVTADMTRVFLEEGAIDLRNARGSCRVAPNSLAVMRTDGPPFGMPFPDPLGAWQTGQQGWWSPPSLDVSLQVLNPGVKVGDSLKIEFTLRASYNDQYVRLDFEPISSASPYYLLTITPPSGSPFTINLSQCHVTEIEPRPTQGQTPGFLALGNGQTYGIRCEIPQMVASRGRYLITAVYGSVSPTSIRPSAGKPPTPPVTHYPWGGLIESKPVIVDVK